MELRSKRIKVNDNSVKKNIGNSLRGTSSLQSNHIDKVVKRKLNNLFDQELSKSQKDPWMDLSYLSEANFNDIDSPTDSSKPLSKRIHSSKKKRRKKSNLFKFCLSSYKKTQNLLQMASNKQVKISHSTVEEECVKKKPELGNEINCNIDTEGHKSISKSPVRNNSAVDLSSNESSSDGMNVNDKPEPGNEIICSIDTKLTEGCNSISNSPVRNKNTVDSNSNKSSPNGINVNEEIIPSTQDMELTNIQMNTPSVKNLLNANSLLQSNNILKGNTVLYFNKSLDETECLYNVQQTPLDKVQNEHLIKKSNDKHNINFQANEHTKCSESSERDSSPEKSVSLKPLSTFLVNKSSEKLEESLLIGKSRNPDIGRHDTSSIISKQDSLNAIDLDLEETVFESNDSTRGSPEKSSNHKNGSDQFPSVKSIETLADGVTGGILEDSCNESLNKKKGNSPQLEMNYVTTSVCSNENNTFLSSNSILGVSLRNNSCSPSFISSSQMYTKGYSPSFNCSDKMYTIESAPFPGSNSDSKFDSNKDNPTSNKNDNSKENSPCSNPESNSVAGMKVSSSSDCVISKENIPTPRSNTECSDNVKENFPSPDSRPNSGVENYSSSRSASSHFSKEHDSSSSSYHNFESDHSNADVSVNKDALPVENESNQINKCLTSRSSSLIKLSEDNSVKENVCTIRRYPRKKEKRTCDSDLSSPLENQLSDSEVLTKSKNGTENTSSDKCSNESLNDNKRHKLSSNLRKRSSSFDESDSCKHSGNISADLIVTICKRKVNITKIVNLALKKWRLPFKVLKNVQTIDTELIWNKANMFDMIKDPNQIKPKAKSSSVLNEKQMNLVYRRWLEFCKLYKFHCKKPRYFFKSPISVQYFSTDFIKYFTSFITQDLKYSFTTDSVLKQFQSLFEDPYDKCSYSEYDDGVLLALHKSLSDRISFVNHIAAFTLKKSYKSVSKRYLKLRNLNPNCSPIKRRKQNETQVKVRSTLSKSGLSKENLDDSSRSDVTESERSVKVTMSTRNKDNTEKCSLVLKTAEERFNYIKDKSETLINLLDGMLEISGRSRATIDQISNETLSEKHWHTISSKLKNIPAYSAKALFQTKIHPLMTSTSVVNKYTLISNILEHLKSKNYKCWEDVKWSEMSKSISELKPLFLFVTFVDFVNNEVPLNQQKNYSDCMDYIFNEKMALVKQNIKDEIILDIFK